MEDGDLVRLSRRAMGCRFELMLAGREQSCLEDAGEEALDRVEALERQLSVFIPDSEVSYINASAALGPVRVEPTLYELLRRAARLSEQTGGAFDVTAGPLVRLWGFAGGARLTRIPSEGEILDALNSVGMRYVQFDDEWCAVRFLRKGMEINLGAIGKGCAVDEIVSFLVERGITSGLIHAGTSTVYGLGNPPGAGSWMIGVRAGKERAERLATLVLKDRALSTSGGYEQHADVEGRTFGHIIDPRTGRPAERLRSATAIAGSAEASDALSTAFFVLGPEGARRFCGDHPEVEAILEIDKPDGSPEVVTTMNHREGEAPAGPSSLRS